MIERKKGTEPMLKLKSVLIIAGLVALSAGCKEPRGPKAPDFKLPAVGGGECDLSAEKGKVVLLEFWSLRCGYCRKEIPELKEVSEKIDPAKVTILAVHVFGGERVAMALERLHQGKNVKVCMDDRTVSKKYTKLAKKYRIRGVPHMLVLDKKGYIRKVHRGLTKASKLLASIKAFQ